MATGSLTVQTWVSTPIAVEVADPAAGDDAERALALGHLDGPAAAERTGHQPSPERRDGHGAERRRRRSTPQDDAEVATPGSRPARAVGCAGRTR